VVNYIQLPLHSFLNVINFTKVIDVAGIARWFLAKFDRRGNLLLLICQYMRGFSDISVHGSERKYNVIEK
jgi:hypothetical protein